MTAAESARVDAGLTLQDVCKRTGYCRRTVRDAELHGGATWVLALQLSRLYKCRMDVFLGRTRKTTECQSPGTRSGVATVPVQRSRRYQPPGTPILTLVE